MGVLKSKQGVYYVRKKVPPKLEAAVSAALGASRPRVSWLKKSLHAKDPREANIRAKLVLMEFDRVLATAAGVLQEMPLRTHLSDRGTKRIAAYHFASVLDEDEEVRREGTGSEELFHRVTQELRDAGVEFWTPFATLAKPPFGLSDREIHHLGATGVLPPCRVEPVGESVPRIRAGHGLHDVLGEHRGLAQLGKIGELCEPVAELPHGAAAL